MMCPGPGPQDSPVSDADHALLSDGRGAPVMSGGAWLTQDPVLPGRMGLLTQVCADDNDVVLRALHPVQLWPPVQGSEGGEGAGERLGQNEREVRCSKGLLQETLRSW